MSENPGTQVQTIAAEDGMTAVAMLSDDAQMTRIIKFAEIMATGRATIPRELQNTGDCMAITMQAMNWKMNPFSVAQKTFFINGRIGYEAQLVSAAISNSGAIQGNFNFDWFGPWEKVVGKFNIIKREKDNKESGKKEPYEFRVPGWELKDEIGIGIRISATLKGETEPRVMEVLLAQARTRNSTLWADDPKQQLAYLAQKKWARLYAPGVILGVYTPDELNQDLTVIDGATGEVISGGKPSNWLDPLLTRIKNAPDLATLNVVCKEGQKKCEAENAVKEYEELKKARKAKLAEFSAANAATATQQPVAEKPEAGSDRPEVTYAFVADKINAAKDRDALDIAADWINSLPEDQRGELTALYRQRSEELA